MIFQFSEFREFQEVKEKAERFDFRKISQQIKELIESVSRAQKINREKYSQISDEAFDFLISEKFKRLPLKEKEIVSRYPRSLSYILLLYRSNFPTLCAHPRRIFLYILFLFHPFTSLWPNCSADTPSKHCNY